MCILQSDFLVARRLRKPHADITLSLLEVVNSGGGIPCKAKTPAGPGLHLVGEVGSLPGLPHYRKQCCL